MYPARAPYIAEDTAHISAYDECIHLAQALWMFDHNLQVLLNAGINNRYMLRAASARYESTVANFKHSQCGLPLACGEGGTLEKARRSYGVMGVRCFRKGRVVI